LARGSVVRLTAGLLVALTCRTTHAQFTDATSSAGLGSVTGTYAVSWGDYNGDGYPDLVVGIDGSPGTLFVNNGDNTFSAGPALSSGSRAAAWGDYDNDGDLDLLRALEYGYLYRNNGNGTFTLLDGASIGFTGFSNLGSVGWIDHNEDGLLDIWAPGGHSGGNHIFQNDGDGTFTDQGSDALGLTPSSNGETTVVVDYDGDGHTDILYRSSAVVLWHSNGNGTFTNVTATAGISLSGVSGGYNGTAFGDYDNDGDLDFYGAQSGTNKLYRNNGDGTFTDVAATAGVGAGSLTSRGVAWGDYDNDGDLDLYVAHSNGTNNLFRNNGDGTFTDVAATVGVDDSAASYGVSFADADLDGDLDLFVANTSSASKFFRNDLNNGNYLKVKVTGAGSGFSPRDGTGSRVELWDGGGSTLLAVREITGGEGYGCQRPHIAHFGVDPSQAYTVRVKLTSGLECVRSGVVPQSESITVGSTVLSNAIEVTEGAGVNIVESGGSTGVSETGPTSDTYTITLNTAPAANVTVTVDPDDQTDVGSGAGVAIDLTFTDSDWDQPQTVTVTAADDAVVEGAHTSTLTHTAASTDGNYDGISIDNVTADVTDDDTAGITVSAISGPTTEAGGTATFTVVLDSEPTAGVTVGLSSSDTTEGTVTPASLTFTSANWDTPQTVTATGTDDDSDDGDAVYTIVIASATSADGNYNGLDPDDVDVTNADDDTAGVTVSAMSGPTTEVGGTATFTVVLNSRPTANVIIGLTSSNATEGTVLPASVTFTPPNWNVPQTVTATGVDDDVDDGDIAYTVVTAAATSTDANYDGLDPDDADATNSDDDTAGVTISVISGPTTEAGGTATFTVVLDSEPIADVTIGLSSDDTTEGTVSPASLTFTPANWDDSQTVTVTGVDDDLADGSVAYTINTSAATSTDAKYDGLDPGDVDATNADDDTAGITVSGISGSTTEVGGTATFMVVLNTQPTVAVTVGLSSSDTTEGTVLPASLTFTPTDWDTPQAATVAGADDAVADGPVAYTIVTAPAASTDANYDGLDPDDVGLTNTDDDAAGLTIVESDGSTMVAETGPTSDTYTVVLHSRPTADVAITATPDTQTDLGGGPGISIDLTFTAGNWDQPQTVTVAADDDAAVEGAHTSTIVHSAASSDAGYDDIAIDSVTVSVSDNDTSGVAILESNGSTVVSEAGPTSDTYEVVLESTPTADVTITVDPDGQTDLGRGPRQPINITFTSDSWDVPRSVVVTAVDDEAVEGSHTSTIAHTAASSDAGYDGIVIDSVTVSVSDNDTAGVAVLESGGSTVVSEAGPTSDTYTVVLQSTPTADVTITIDPDDQIDLGGGPGQAIDMTFTSDGWAVPRTVVVTAVDDAAAEGDHTSTITHAATSLDEQYDELSIPAVNVMVEDNDASDDVAGVIVTESGGSTVVSEAGPTSDTYEVVLESTPTADVTITATPDVQTDLSKGPGVSIDLTFTADTWEQPQTVTVLAVDDAEAEGVRTSVITHAATSSDGDYNGVGIDSVTATVQDDDATGVTIAELNSATAVIESGGTCVYTLALSAEPADAVTIAILPGPPLDVGGGPGVPGELTFDSSNWFIPQAVTVSAVTDQLEAGPHVATIEHRVSGDDDGLMLAALSILVINGASEPNVGGGDANAPDRVVEAVTVTTKRFGWCGPIGPFPLGVIVLTLIALRCGIGPGARRTRHRTFE